MEARIKQQLNEIKKSLIDTIKDDATTTDTEKVMDILIAISALPLTASIIKDTKIGSLISKVKSKYTTNEEQIQILNSSLNSNIPPTFNQIVNKTKEILIGWKNIMEKESKLNSTTTIESTTITESRSSPIPSNKMRTNSPIPLSKGTENEFKLLLNKLPEQRKRIYNLFLDHLKKSPYKSLPELEAIALKIENSVNDLSSFDKHLKEYNSKVRSLLFNLKKNENLRENLISGSVTSNELVKFSLLELANNETRIKKQKEYDYEIDGRRTDWLNEHKVELQVGLGLDPNNIWVYDEDSDISVNED